MRTSDLPPEKQTESEQDEPRCANCGGIIEDEFDSFVRTVFCSGCFDTNRFAYRMKYGD